MKKNDELKVIELHDIIMDILLTAFQRNDINDSQYEKLKILINSRDHESKELGLQMFQQILNDKYEYKYRNIRGYYGRSRRRYKRTAQ